MSRNSNLYYPPPQASHPSYASQQPGLFGQYPSQPNKYPPRPGIHLSFFLLNYSCFQWLC